MIRKKYILRTRIDFYDDSLLSPLASNKIVVSSEASIDGDDINGEIKTIIIEEIKKELIKQVENFLPKFLEKGLEK